MLRGDDWANTALWVMKTTFPHFFWPISRLGSYRPFLGKLSCCCICIIGVCGCVSFKGYTGTQSWISEMSQRWEDLPNKTTLEDDMYYQWLIQTKGFGGSQIGGRQKGLHLRKRLSATIVGSRTKVVTFCRPKMAIFVGRTMRFFKKKTQFESALIQKTFGTGPKQWVSFFTSYTDLAYLQNVLERYKCMLRASVCHCFGHP